MLKKDEKAGSFTSFLAGLFISLIFTVIITGEVFAGNGTSLNYMLLAIFSDVVIAIIVGALWRKKSGWYWAGAFLGLVFGLYLFFIFIILSHQY